MKLAIASDHGGFILKQEVANFLKQKNNLKRYPEGIEVIDYGNHGQESVDYPDYAIEVAQGVSEKKVDLGLLLCGTGIGMCIAANKFKDVRAAVVSDSFSAKMAKEHNNANVLCLGGRVVDIKAAREILTAWLDSEFEGGRHNRRLDKIRNIEKKNFK